MGETSAIAISKNRKIQNQIFLDFKLEIPGKETIYIKDTLSCKEWSSKDMIRCADAIVTKSSAQYDCQLPMSIKIGKGIFSKEIIISFFIVF